MPATDLSKLPDPEVINQQSYEETLQQLKDDLISLDPSLVDALNNESEPVTLQLRVCAYRETLLRQEFNDRAKGLLLAKTSGSDLDHIGTTYYFTERLVIDAGDPDAVPPVEPTYELDNDYRNRCLIAEDAFSTAGPDDAYIYHAKSADADVKDVKPTSPNPVEVVINVLSHTGDGTADAALLAKVDAALSNNVRPLTDQVTVQSATIINYTVDATLIFYTSADENLVLTAAEANLTAWAIEQHKLGRDITTAGVKSALKVEGVHDVTLNNNVGTDITANIAVADNEAAYNAGITIASGGVSE